MVRWGLVLVGVGQIYRYGGDIMEDSHASQVNMDKPYS